MKKDTEIKSNSFRAPLLELVIVIGIFAIVSVYLLRMFMVADRLQGKAISTTKAVVLAESAAESIKAIDGHISSKEFLSRIKEATGSTETEAGTYVIKYNKSWEVTDADNASFILTIVNTDLLLSDNRHDFTITVTSADLETEYCKLTVSKTLDAPSSVTVDREGGSHE